MTWTLPTGQQCRYPIGEPRSPDFRFCEGVRVTDKPYCKKCCKIVYQPRPPVPIAKVPE